MTVYDALYFYGMMQVGGLIVGLTFSIFFDWISWGPK